MRNRHLSPILLCVAIAAPRAHTAGGGQDLPRPTPAAVPARHQDPERRPSDPEPRARVAAVGIVEASGGASLPGATVRCVGVVPATHDTFAAPDVVTATTDARGRFRVELLDDHVYSAFALGPATDDRFEASGVVEGVTAGSVQRLRCGTARPRAQLRVHGLDAWTDGRPFTVRVRVDAIAAEWHELALDQDGVAELPPLPAHRLRIVLVDREGLPLSTHSGEPVDGRIHHFVAPPRPLPVRVVDEDGAGVAGATVAWQLDGIPAGRDGDRLGARAPFEVVRPLGTTDAEGRLLARLPCHPESWHAFVGNLVLFASEPGRAESWSGWLSSQRVVEDRVEPEDADGAASEEPFELRFVLPRAPAWQGRIVDNGAPVAGLGVRLDCTCRLPAGPNAWFGLSRSLHTRTDRDGSFAFASVPRSASTLRLNLQARPGESAPRLAFFDAVPAEAVRIDLAALPVLRLQALTADGGPAIGARGLVLPVRPGAVVDGTPGFMLDRAGRAEQRVQAGSWMLLVTDGEGHALQPVELDAAGAELDLRLEPLSVMRGIVRDGDGEPVGGARFVLGSTEGRRVADDPVSRWLAHYGFEINRALLRPVRSAADGTFELHFLAVEGRSYGGSVNGGRGIFRLEARDDVELRIER